MTYNICIDWERRRKMKYNVVLDRTGSVLETWDSLEEAQDDADARVFHKDIACSVVKCAEIDTFYEIRVLDSRYDQYDTLEEAKADLNTVLYLAEHVTLNKITEEEFDTKLLAIDKVK